MKHNVISASKAPQKGYRLVGFLICVSLLMSQGMLPSAAMIQEEKILYLPLIIQRGGAATVCGSQNYYDLLTRFPLDRQGYGPEPAPNQPSHQPMTYALILSAEVLRYHNCPTQEGKERIRAAALWLVENSDLDQDQKLGWGLPDPWDAYADGSVNPANHPYTITTALDMEALLAASELTDVFSAAEHDALMQVMRAVTLRWVNEVWAPLDTGGFFLYSPGDNDDYFTPNVSAYFSGAIQTLLSRHPEIFTPDELSQTQDRVDLAARSIIAATEMRNGLPFWAYILDPRKPLVGNSSVHHAYIIWGMEVYRDNGGSEIVPWTTEQSVASLETFFVNSHVFDFPQDVEYGNPALQDRPARLWGAGMMLAFAARYGEQGRVEEYLAIIEQDYGSIPDLKMWPPWFIEDPVFYPRFTSHVLFGIAYLDFYSN